VEKQRNDSVDQRKGSERLGFQRLDWKRHRFPFWNQQSSFNHPTISIMMTVIEIRQFQTARKVRCSSFQPAFFTKEDTVDYAQNRARFRSGEIRILDLNGKVERTIPFSEVDRKM